MKKILCFLIGLLACMLNVSAQTDTISYGKNTSAGHYAQINGIQLYYETYGSGEPLIMLHGNGGSIDAFRFQIPFFAKYYQVIAIDSRLQGKSGVRPIRFPMNKWLPTSALCWIICISNRPMF